jgi:hypothetical protein
MSDKKCLIEYCLEHLARINKIPLEWETTTTTIPYTHTLLIGLWEGAVVGIWTL